jgi:surfactin synthase thioesterase subunit
MEKPQLFLIHFAGGNSYSFQGMFHFLNTFEVVPLELPGRGKRSNETLLKNFDSAADDLYGQILNKLKTTYFVIYGHSMGAYLALKIANIFKKNQRSPLCLIVSGNPGPGISSKNRHLLNDAEFTRELELLGGFPKEILEHKELMEFFLPVLRADFEMSENNGMEKEPAIGIPISALMGDVEEFSENITNWKKYTTSVFDYKILKGDHFFINNQPQKTAEFITQAYYKAVASIHFMHN